MAEKNPKLDPEPGSNTEKPPEQWVSGDEPMTGAQASYLTTLCEEAKVEPPRRPADQGPGIEDDRRVEGEAWPLAGADRLSVRRIRRELAARIGSQRSPLSSSFSLL